MRLIGAILLAAILCFQAQAQDRIRGSALTQITTPAGNYFLWFISTNGAGSNYIAKVSDLLSAFGLGSNSTVLTITGSNALFATSTTTGASVTSNPWQGPTNQITLGATNSYWYVAVTPCAVTGFVYTSTLANYSLLTISNAASTNITFTTIASGPQEDASSTFTITNGFVLKSWMEYSHGMTNQVTRIFRP